MSLETLDKWRRWGTIEYGYAFEKYKTQETGVSHFNQGVVTGERAWLDQAHSYFRGKVFEQGLGTDKVIDLKYSQSFLKAGFNILACASVAQVAFGKQGQVVDSFNQLVDQWGVVLATLDASHISETPDNSELTPGYTLLEQFQKTEDSYKFMRLIQGIALPICATSVVIAEKYGWPKPGVSSTEDVTDWEQ
jgi:hypothetical protein